MMMLITTILLLLGLLVVQVAMILQSELVTKYIVSMRNHGGRRAPTYITRTTTAVSSGLSEKYFQRPTIKCDDDDGYNNISTVATSAFNPKINDDLHSNLDCNDD